MEKPQQVQQGYVCYRNGHLSETGSVQCHPGVLSTPYPTHRLPHTHPSPPSLQLLTNQSPNLPCKQLIWQQILPYVKSPDGILFSGRSHVPSPEGWLCPAPSLRAPHWLFFLAGLNRVKSQPSAKWAPGVTHTPPNIAKETTHLLHPTPGMRSMRGFA